MILIPQSDFIYFSLKVLNLLFQVYVKCFPRLRPFQFIVLKVIYKEIKTLIVKIKFSCLQEIGCSISEIKCRFLKTLAINGINNHLYVQFIETHIFQSYIRINACVSSRKQIAFGYFSERFVLFCFVLFYFSPVQMLPTFKITINIGCCQTLLRYK